VITAGTLSASTFAVTDDSVLVDFWAQKNGNIVDLCTVVQGATSCATGGSGGSGGGASSGGYVLGDGSTVSGGVTNSGTISGPVGIALATNGAVTGSIINNAGATITGTGGVAIDLSNATNRVEVTNSGTINGTVNGNANLTNNGLLSLSESPSTANTYGTSSISGDYTQGSTGKLQIGAYGTGAGQYNKLVVGGTATLPSNAQIDVNVKGTNLFGTGGETLAGVISAGTLVSDGTFAVTSNSVLVDFVGVKNSNAVDLTAVAHGGETPTPTPTPTPPAPSVAFEGSVKAVGSTPSMGAANVFDRLLTTSLANGSTGNAGMDAVLNTIISSNSGTQQQVANALSQTLPLHTGGESAAITGSLHSVNHIVQSRQEGQHGRSSGDEFYEDGRAWAKPFGSVATQGDYNNVSGFSAVTGGIVFGADAEIKSSNRLGVAVAAANTDVSGNSAVAPQSSNVATYQLAVYGSHSFNEVTDINFQADIGTHINKGNRRIVFMGTTAQSNYHSLSEHVGVGAAHTLTLSEVNTFTPSVRADYTTVLNNAYTESGAGALNLNVDKSVVNEMLLTADGKFTRKVQENTTLTANLGVSYDSLAKQNSITSAYAGDALASFTTLGLNASPWMARGGLGFVRTQNGTEVTLRYDVDARTSHLVNQTVSAKVRWAF
jgi:outer membrane autotransporter protein